jgi:CBS domain containing-hemolysin-like protein
MDWDTIISIGLRVMAVLVLVFLNGFFVAAEFALVKVRDTQLRPLIQKGDRRATVAAYILPRLDAFLSAAQLGITLASLALGWIGEPVFEALLSPVFGWLNIESAELRRLLAFLVGFSALTFLHISAGEQAPKWLAIQRPLPTTLAVAYPMLWFYRLSYPFVVALNQSSQWLLKQVGLGTVSEEGHPHSEEELRLLLSAAQKRQEGPGLARNILLNALDLRRRRARDVMRPRQEIVGFSMESTIPECLDIAEKTRYSRFPLCEAGDLDKTLGVVHIKDLYAFRLKSRTAAELMPVARKLIYIPESAHLEKLLQMFLEKKLHLAIVIDEYGTTTGMVTLENILEELVGQIQDEFDQEKPLLVRLGEETFELSGALPLHELEEIVGEPLQEEGVTTLSGWFTHKRGGFPRVGDTLNAGNCELRVEEMEGMRVARVKLTKKPVPEHPPVTA